jgi:hypothetical protein
VALDRDDHDERQARIDQMMREHDGIRPQARRQLKAALRPKKRARSIARRKSNRK